MQLAEINKLFEMFWVAGMYKTKKKKARVSFARVIKQQDTPWEFTNMLVKDIKKRLEINQFGFSSLHPTSYLNGERWEDEYRGQVDEKSNGHNQSFGDRQREQARKAMQAMDSGHREINIGNIR